MALDFTPIWPVTLAGLGAMAVLMLEVFLSRRATSAWIGSALMWTALAFLAAAGVAGVVGFAAGEVSVFPAARPMIRLDPLAGFAIGRFPLLGLALVIQLLPFGECDFTFGPTISKVNFQRN